MDGQMKLIYEKQKCGPECMKITRVYIDLDSKNLLFEQVKRYDNDDVVNSVILDEEIITELTLLKVEAAVYADSLKRE